MHALSARESFKKRCPIDTCVAGFEALRMGISIDDSVEADVKGRIPEESMD